MKVRGEVAQRAQLRQSTFDRALEGLRPSRVCDVVREAPAALLDRLRNDEPA
ncbi:MAG: hypothetical protein IT379_36625 [Deltaproteobacteria bacterium]|nr:hypothetical protein [Deltaproteobacteria bacterium]